jgi:hypothetical protein
MILQELLPNSTLEDGVTYYAATENGCEHKISCGFLSILYLQMTMSKCFVMI